MKTPRASLLMVSFWCVCAGNAFGQATPTDVYKRVLEVAAEVHLIRLEMGVRDTAKPDFAISGAQPREVYFQALTMHEKANRLLFEQLRERDDAPLPSPKKITPDAVLPIVNRTLELVLRIKQSLGTTEAVTLEESDGTRTPSDVYKLVIRVNRTLNLLLQQRFEPAEVYQQLTNGVSLSSSILATVVSAHRLGKEPPLAPRKTPGNVYGKLLKIYAIIYETLKLSGQECLVLGHSESERDDVSPSDVYDLASLLVSELSYLHSVTPDVGTPKGSYYPGNKLPSHVYQRAGRLESQVNTLHTYVSTHPTWLKSK